MPPAKPSNRKYAYLLEDPNIKRWYENVSRGSVVTASVYLRRLGAFCNDMGTNPGALLSMKEAGLHALLLDFVGKEERNNQAGSYIASTVKAVKSWLAHNGVAMTRQVKIRGATQTPTLANERVPTPEELRRIFLAGTTRDRVSSAIIAHCGLRLESLGNYTGHDGLRVMDLPEMLIKGKKVSFKPVPTMVVIRPELSKARHRYFTFLSEEGCEHLRAYLEERLRAGEKFGPDSDIISPKSARKRFMTTINIGDGVRNAIRAAGFKWRPYVLRAYFDTQLLLAESKGKITPAYRQFFMGHKGNIEAHYTTNKGSLPKDLVEDMRDAYKRCQPFLQTTKAGSSEEDLKAAFRRELLLVAGMTPEEIDKLALSDMGDEEIKELVRKRLVGAITGNGGKQKVVPMAEVEGYIQKGWEYVAALPDARAVVKVPE